MSTMTSLQNEKLNLTRDRIMRALAEEICLRGAHEISVQDVADRAGVSHRTVYRHFETKDGLLKEYGDWLDEILAEEGGILPTELSQLTEGAAATFRRFESHPRLMEAYVRIQATGTTLEVRRERSRQFLQLVADATPGLSDEYQRALAAVMRQVVNSQTWAGARQEFGVGGEPLERVVTWAVGMFVDAAREGRLPDNWNDE